MTQVNGTYRYLVTGTSWRTLLILPIFLRKDNYLPGIGSPSTLTSPFEKL